MDTRFKTSDIDEIGPTDGLIAYYNMDTLDGTTLLDNSGNGNNATNVGATLATGINGNALSFNGINNWAYPTPCWQNLAEFTISMWVKKNGFTQYQSLFIDYGSGYQNLLIGYENPEGTLRFYCGYGTTPRVLATPEEAFDTNWNHWVFTFKASTFMRIYKNNTMIAERIADISPTFAADYSNYIFIGRYNSIYFNGLIDEFRFYNKALNSAEISHLYKLNSKHTQLFTDNYESSLNYSNTISLTTNVSGNNVKNDVTGEIIGTISGAIYTDATKSFNFDGIDDYINIGDNARLNTGGTISMWFYAKSTGEYGYGRLIDKSIDLNSTNGYFIYLYNGAKISVGINATDAIIQSPSFPSLNAWHHIAVVIASTKKEMWIDGIKVANNTNTSLPPDIAGNVFIGNRAVATDRTFDGYIKNVRIYTRDLKSEEIRYLYNEGK